MAKKASPAQLAARAKFIAFVKDKNAKKKSTATATTATKKKTTKKKGK